MTDRKRPWKVFVYDIGPTFSFATEERAVAHARSLVAGKASSPRNGIIPGDYFGRVSVWSTEDGDNRRRIVTPDGETVQVFEAHAGSPWLNGWHDVEDTDVDRLRAKLTKNERHRLESIRIDLLLALREVKNAIIRSEYGVPDEIATALNDEQGRLQGLIESVASYQNVAPPPDPNGGRDEFTGRSDWSQR